MTKRPLHCILLAIVCAGCLILGMAGCDGSDTRKQVDDTVEEMTGKKDLDRYQHAKQALGKIEKQAAERYDRLDAAETDRAEQN